VIEIVRRFMGDENLAFCLPPRAIAVGGCQMMLGSQLDPAQKRIQVSDTRGGEAKILDSGSNSQIHLWSKSKILRRRARLDGSTSHSLNVRSLAEPLTPKSKI
jgi:hypothetical protein